MNTSKSLIVVVMFVAFAFVLATTANADFQVFFDDFEDDPLGAFPTGPGTPVVGDGWYDGWANGSEIVVDSPVLNGNRALQATRNHPNTGGDPILFPAHDAVSVYGQGVFSPTTGTSATFIWNIYRADATSGPEIEMKPGAKTMAGFWVDNNGDGLQGTNRIWASGSDTGVDSIPGEWETYTMLVSFVQAGPTLGGTYDLLLSNTAGANQLIADDIPLTATPLGDFADDTLRFRINGHPNAVDGSLNVVYYDDVEIRSSIPEPATLSLLGFGLAGLWRRRKLS